MKLWPFNIKRENERLNDIDALTREVVKLHSRCIAQQTRLDAIAGMETEYANGTVRRMAALARGGPVRKIRRPVAANVRNKTKAIRVELGMGEAGALG